MASVYCKSCKAKITPADSTCPSCGSPTNPLIPFILCIALVAAGLMLYTTYQKTAGSQGVESNTANSPAIEEPQSRVGLNDD